VQRSEGNTVNKQVGENPNTWFYNDVRSIGSTLFSPKISVQMDIEKMIRQDMKVGELLRNYQVRFEVSLKV
jgi:hypothetical protein